MGGPIKKRHDVARTSGLMQPGETILGDENAIFTIAPGRQVGGFVVQTDRAIYMCIQARLGLGKVKEVHRLAVADVFGSKFRRGGASRESFDVGFMAADGALTIGTKPDDSENENARFVVVSFRSDHEGWRWKSWWDEAVRAHRSTAHVSEGGGAGDNGPSLTPDSAPDSTELVYAFGARCKQCDHRWHLEVTAEEAHHWAEEARQTEPTWEYKYQSHCPECGASYQNAFDMDGILKAPPRDRPQTDSEVQGSTTLTFDHSVDALICDQCQTDNILEASSCRGCGRPIDWVMSGVARMGAMQFGYVAPKPTDPTGHPANRP